MSGFRAVLVICLMGFGVSGCVTTAASLAMTAVSMVNSGGNSQTPFKNPIDKHTTGRQIRDALSRLDDQVDPACQQMLDEHHASEPWKAKPTGETTTVSSTETAATSVAVSSESTEKASAVAGVEASGGSETVRMVAVSRQEKDTTAELTTEDVASEGGPGACEHRLVCLPGTPKPTMMLMCPGKNTAENETDEASEASTKTAATPAESATSVDAKTPAEPATAPPQKGGVADWNWSHDPAKQL